MGGMTKLQDAVSDDENAKEGGDGFLYDEVDMWHNEQVIKPKDNRLESR